MTTQQELRECIKRCEEKSISWWPAHDLRMLLEAAKATVSTKERYDNRILTGRLRFKSGTLQQEFRCWNAEEPTDFVINWYNVENVDAD